MALPTILRPTAEFLSKYSPSFSLTNCVIWPAISLFSLPLVWPSNCGCGTLTLTTAVRPSRTSSPDEVFFHVLEQPGLLAEGVDGARQRGAEAAEVRAAIDGVDVVGEAEDVFGVAVVVLQRHFHA